MVTVGKAGMVGSGKAGLVVTPLARSAAGTVLGWLGWLAQPVSSTTATTTVQDRRVRHAGWPAIGAPSLTIKFRVFH
jgi:hypothetical protein